MASYVTPKKGVEFIFYVGLPATANASGFQANPTIASGDFKVSIDGGSLNNLSTLPTVTPASGKMVKITLSTSEMNGDNITVVGSDASGAEWRDVLINIQTSARQIDDLAFPNTSGRGMDVDASGGVEVGSFQAGAITSGAFAAGAIDNAAIAADAIGSSELAASAVTEIQSGLATSSALSTLQTSVDDLPTNAELATALGTIAGYIDTEIGTLQTSVNDLPTNAELATALGTADDAVLAAIAGLNNLSAAQVNAEVVDALNVDTYAEPGQGTPGATISLAAKIGYLFKAWRNKKTVTATEHALFNDDASTVDHKSTLSDAAGTFTETEKTTGP